uniref:Uncharacterized protein n=1 Tax=Eutreptiella gymnastica TaxID=73025 RepID=A0A7S1IW16_9EUGL
MPLLMQGVSGGQGLPPGYSGWLPGVLPGVLGVALTWPEGSAAGFVADEGVSRSTSGCQWAGVAPVVSGRSGPNLFRVLVPEDDAGGAVPPRVVRAPPTTVPATNHPGLTH